MRLKNWDYRWKGSYFITIVAKDWKHHFGEIVEGKMELSEIGKFAHKFWDEIPAHFPHVDLDVFVVMPHHVHGILRIMKDVSGKDPRDAEPEYSLDEEEDSEESSESMTSILSMHFSSVSPKSGSVSTIIRSYKSVVTKNSRLINPEFAWKPKFHDHIIRNPHSFLNIRRYIVNNPAKWHREKNL